MKAVSVYVDTNAMIGFVWTVPRELRRKIERRIEKGRIELATGAYTIAEIAAAPPKRKENRIAEAKRLRGVCRRFLDENYTLVVEQLRALPCTGLPNAVYLKKGDLWIRALDNIRQPLDRVQLKAVQEKMRRCKLVTYLLLLRTWVDPHSYRDTQQGRMSPSMEKWVKWVIHSATLTQLEEEEASMRHMGGRLTLTQDELENRRQGRWQFLAFQRRERARECASYDSDLQLSGEQWTALDVSEWGELPAIDLPLDVGYQQMWEYWEGCVPGGNRKRLPKVSDVVDYHHAAYAPYVDAFLTYDEDLRCALSSSQVARRWCRGGQVTVYATWEELLESLWTREPAPLCTSADSAMSLILKPRMRKSQ